MKLSSINIYTLLLNILIFANTLTLNAQHKEEYSSLKKGTGLVVGKVIETGEERALQFASVSVYKTSDQSIITGGITDENGRFKIEVPYGEYYILIDFMGFAKKQTKEFEINKANPIAKLYKIEIDPNTDIISEIEVTSEKELFENKIDSKTFNVSKDLTMQSKSALEALEQIPSISVDLDGNITLRGNKNIRILINDRPIIVNAENQASLLEQIQANNIESIDVITNPSAKYNPEGMGGIINIQLKKSQPNGKNLSVSVGSDFYREYSANISAGLRTKKFNIYGTYGYKYNRWNYERESYQKNIFSAIDTSYYMKQTSEGGRNNNSHMGTFGLDYNINKRNTIGIESLISYANKDKANPYNYSFFDENEEIVNSSIRDNTEDILQYKFDLQAHYKHKFAKEKHYLEANISAIRNSKQKDANYFEQSTFPSIGDTLDLENNLQDENNKIYNYKINHFYPISKNKSLETGFDGEFRNIDNQIDILSFDTDRNEFTTDTLRSSQFNYFDQTHAVYSLFKTKYNKLTIQMGLRLEYRNYQFDFNNNTNSTTPWRWNYYPSLHLQYKLNPTSEFGASYSKRVNRPSIRQLNPLHDYSDAYNYRVGNPNLKPENIHSVELNYSKRIKKLKIMPAIYYKYIDQVIKRIKTRDSLGMGVVTYMNLDYGSSYGSELISSYKPYKWLNLNGSINLGYSKLQDKTDDNLSNEDFFWSGKLMSYFLLPYQIKLQLSYHYHGQRVIPQGYIDPMQWLDIGLRKSFWNKKASISIRASDIFRTRAFNIHIDTPEYISDLHFKRKPSYILVNFTYQIGRKTKRAKKMRSSRNNDDIGM